MIIQWVDYTVGPSGLELHHTIPGQPVERLLEGRKVKVSTPHHPDLNDARMVIDAEGEPQRIDVTWDFEPSGRLVLADTPKRP